MKNLGQIIENQDIITKEYLVAGYEPLLPATPLEPGTKYLNGNRQWSTIAIGSGGYAANVYLTNTNSTLNPAYKALSYINDINEVESTITRNSIGETQGVTFLFDTPIGITTIDAGTWKFAWTGKVSTSAGGTKLRIEVFKRTSTGTETVLFSVTTDTLSDTTYTYRTLETNQPIFTVNTTDTLGVKTYMQTTVAATVTGYILIGGTRSAFINSPLALRHTQLRGLNDDVNNVHVTSTERTNLTAITALSTVGFIRRTGSGTYSIDTSVYALSTHNHNGTYQPADADLTSIAGLTGTTGLLRKTAANTWTLDTTVLGDMTIAIYGGSESGVVAKADALKETRAGATQKTWVGTKAQYNAIVTKDSGTCYITTDETYGSYISLDETGHILASYMPSSVSTHIASTSNPHGVTRSQVGLGNVDNTADIDKPISLYVQAALDLKSASNHTHSIYSLTSHTHSQYAPINNPTFTGTVAGITANMVGLGNVTNESKSTMFTSPTFTGNVIMNTSTVNVELGNPTASNSPLIDFHSSGNNIDYDARIIATGGTSTSGQGTLSFQCAPVNTGLRTYTIGQMRNIFLNTAVPSSGDGSNGDVWIVYT